MPDAPAPSDEASRIASLAAYRILDTPHDPNFDTVVHLAADLYDVPIALISLTDTDRQWVKAAVGFQLRQVSRTSAFSAYAILRPDEVMVVEDATLDPRFANSPLVLGEPRVRFYAGAPIRAVNGQPLGTVCIADHTPRHIEAPGLRHLANLAVHVGLLLELHRKTLLLEEAATIDPLTGLFNRRRFEGELSAATDGALAGRPCALLCLDLDHFKQINDTYGHDVGDDLLREVGRRLTRVARGNDLVARVGGDEFAVLMSGPVEISEAETMAARIVQAFAQVYSVGGFSAAIQTSIGVALCPIHGIGPAGLRRAADQAMYAAKQSGGGRIATASGQVGSGLTAINPDGPAARLIADLERAVSYGALSLHWQPYLNVRKGEIIGYEALVRWDRPGHGRVEPSVFVAIAEMSGLIASLDRWVLGQACQEAAAWPSHLRISVNISGYWFGRGDLLELLAGTLSRTGLAPGRLTLELTERTLIEHSDCLRERIEALHAMGVQVALDDFGNGYSSLSYLREFPFDTLKLDRGFVSALHGDGRAEAVARAVLQLGANLGMQVCAEGVETKAQLDFLKAEGCDLVQGYFLDEQSQHQAAARA
jgi:diguanylate cyclase